MPRNFRSHAAMLTLAVVLSACATTPAVVSPEQRTQFGRVRVSATDAAPKVAVSGPTPLGGVGGGVAGAGKGLGLSVVFGAACFVTLGYWLEPCIGVLATPYLIGRGIVEGAIKAIPESERRQYQAIIVNAAGETRNDALVRRVVEEGKRRSAVLLVDDESDTVAQIALVKLGLDTADIPSTESVWAISVPNVDPSLQLIAETQLRVIHVASNRLLFEKTYRHRGARAAKLAQWADIELDAFRAAREEAMDELARVLADDLFGEGPRSPEDGFDEP